MSEYSSNHRHLPSKNPRATWEAGVIAKQRTHRATHLTTEICNVRKSILDALEIAYGDTNAWPRVRSLILRLFGKSGLEGAIDAAFNRPDKEVNGGK